MPTETYRRAIELDGAYVMHTYGRSPVLFERGEGMRLYDDEGTAYLDFLAAIAVCPLGHAHPAVTAAVSGQAGRLLQSSNYFYSLERGEVAAELARLAGPEHEWKSFFGNSGAEANECAMKVARRWGVEHKGPGCQTIVVMRGGFHGRTMETLAATAQDWLQEPFQPLPGGFRPIPVNDCAALDAAVGPDVCAIMMEPVQGESGVWPLTDEFLMHVRKTADERGCLVIFDEVQTGLYRTGRPFCFQTVEAAGPQGVVPDIFTLAKGIANGVPCGACVARGEVAEVMRPGMQGSTFGGGQIAMAAAKATLTSLAKLKLDGRAAEMGAYLRGRLAEVPYVTDVRGKGLMVGATIEGFDAHDVVARLLTEHHIVANACNDTVLRFLPPLIVGAAEIDELVDALKALA